MTFVEPEIWDLWERIDAKEHIEEWEAKLGISKPFHLERRRLPYCPPGKQWSKVGSYSSADEAIEVMNIRLVELI